LFLVKDSLTPAEALSRFLDEYDCVYTLSECCEEAMEQILGMIYDSFGMKRRFFGKLKTIAREVSRVVPPEVRGGMAVKTLSDGTLPSCRTSLRKRREEVK